MYARYLPIQHNALKIHRQFRHSFTICAPIFLGPLYQSHYNFELLTCKLNMPVSKITSIYKYADFYSTYIQKNVLQNSSNILFFFYYFGTQQLRNSTLTSVIEPLNPKVAADSRSNFLFKCSYLHLPGAIFSLSAIKSYVMGHLSHKANTEFSKDTLSVTQIKCLHHIFQTSGKKENLPCTANKSSSLVQRALIRLFASGGRKSSIPSAVFLFKELRLCLLFCT